MLRQLAIEDMDSAAVVHRMSFDQALPTLAGLHTPDEDRWFFKERVFAACQIWGYFEDTVLVGFIAFREGWIDQLYVLPSSQGQGVGAALLQVAQSRFVLVKETGGARNEEKEPDAMCSWPPNGHGKD